MSSTSKPLVDMCLYKNDGTPVWPPDDLKQSRVKSMDGDDGEWRVVTAEWCHVFNAEYAGENKNSLVKGYGRITALEKYPEVFYEFAFWDVPGYDMELPVDEQPQPFWDSRDVHWEHTWQNFHE